MKTTVELPDHLLRDAKATAAARGQTLRAFVGDAIADRVRRLRDGGDEKPWMRHLGSLHDHAEGLDSIERIIEEEFETVDRSLWRRSSTSSLCRHS